MKNAPLEDLFLIIAGDKGLKLPYFTYWGPGRSGYTGDIGKAGKYTKAEALDIVKYSDDAVAVPLSKLIESSMLIVDKDHLHYGLRDFFLKMEDS